MGEPPELNTKPTLNNHPLAAETPLVLVVDSSKMVRELIAIILRKSGYRVLEAESGLAAQLALQVVSPALIVSDLEMPGGNGWDLIDYCHLHHPLVPLLITSGHGRGQQPLIERFATAFIPKPFSVLRFRTEIQRLRPIQPEVPHPQIIPPDLPLNHVASTSSRS